MAGNAEFYKMFMMLDHAMESRGRHEVIPQCFLSQCVCVDRAEQLEMLVSLCVLSLCWCICAYVYVCVCLKKRSKQVSLSVYQI